MTALLETRNWLIIAGTVIAVCFAALHLKTGPAAVSPEVIKCLEQLRAQCNPDQPGNDYEWSTSTQPTERRRMDLLKQLSLHPGETTRAILQLRASGVPGDEFDQMLTLTLLRAEDEASVQSACRLMGWSGYPAVRICAAEMLRALRKKSCAEWFVFALNDERVVLNNACGFDGDGRLYPVRLIALLALEELGMTADQIERLSTEGK